MVITQRMAFLDSVLLIRKLDLSRVHEFKYCAPNGTFYFQVLDRAQGPSVLIL